MPPHDEDPRPHDAWRFAPRNAVALALLREVPALRAVGLRGAGDPLGRRRVERSAASARAVHALRPQGRDHSTPGMGRR